MTHDTLGLAGAEGRSVGSVTTQRVRLWTESEPLQLESGETLGPIEVAFETYGRLDADAANAVVVCHALTGDAHATGTDSATGASGWWETMIGPERPVDTDRFFVVCANLLGGCKGTTGPGSIDPHTAAPYGLRFPHFSMRDLVAAHRGLLRALGIERPYAAIGGSLGGMQILQWVLDHPDELGRAVVIGVAPRLSTQNIAISAVARAAIMRDENFSGGDYYTTGRRPEVGLAVARMLAHITYLSAGGLEQKFGRDRRGNRQSFDVDFEVESYLHYQGEKFLERFDANSYLYLSRVMDYFEPFADEGAAVQRLRRSGTRFLVVSFDSDWRFPPVQSRELVGILERAGCDVDYRELSSIWGHDSFLLPLPEYLATVAEFLGGG